MVSRQGVDKTIMLLVHFQAGIVYGQNYDGI